MKLITIPLARAGDSRNGMLLDEHALHWAFPDGGGRILLSSAYHLIFGLAESLSGHELRLILVLSVAWLVLGLAGFLRPNSIRFVAHLLFPIGAVLCLGVAVLAGHFLASGQPPQTVILPLGLPDLPFHIRLDVLSGFFLLLLGVAGVGV